MKHAKVVYIVDLKGSINAHFPADPGRFMLVTSFLKIVMFIFAVSITVIMSQELLPSINLRRNCSPQELIINIRQHHIYCCEHMVTKAVVLWKLETTTVPKTSRPDI